MKKLFLSIVTTLLLFSPSFAANVEMLPTMQSKTNVQDRVWVGTFQIVWNDFMDRIVHSIIKFPDGTPVMVNELNKQDFTVDELSDKSYYRYVGKVQKNTKKIITKAIKKKFNEKSDILDQLDMTPASNKYLVYAMLKKDFEYAKALNKLKPEAFKGSEGDIEYFGILKSSKTSARDIVNVLFYNDMNDFAVSLKTKQNDVVYLYRTNDNKTFSEYYSDMNKKANVSKTNREFTKNDELKIPNLDFKTETLFGELCNKAIKNSDLVIAKAIETVEFKMDNVGVKLKSEAGIEMMRVSLEPPQKSRYFYLTGQYVIFLQDKNKRYFALKVADAKALQK